MTLFWIKVGAVFRDLWYYTKKFFRKLFGAVLDLLYGVFDTVCKIIYAVLSKLFGFTEIGFIVGIVFLILNIKECYTTKINFVDARFYAPMFWLLIVHVGVYAACKLLRKYLEKAA